MVMLPIMAATNQLLQLVLLLPWLLLLLLLQLPVVLLQGVLDSGQCPAGRGPSHASALGSD